MTIYFAVTSVERERLFAGDATGPLYGQDRIEWDLSGTDEDALWVKAEVSEAQASRFEEAAHPDWPLREFIFHTEALSALVFRPADPNDFPDAPWRLQKGAMELVDRLSERISADHMSPVRTALSDEDGPEAVRRLAWVIRQENVSISMRDLNALRRLGQQAEGDMPPSLGEQVRLPD